MDALTVAQSARNLLDEAGKHKTKVMLINTQDSEIRDTLGNGMEKWLANALSRQRISYIPNAKIVSVEGSNELEQITFNKEEDYGPGRIAKVDYFVKPDMVIVENGIDRPQKELIKMVGSQDSGSAEKVKMNPEYLPIANLRFSLCHQNISSPIFAAGSATLYPGFI